MKNIDKILKTITVLYYIFVVVFVSSFIFEVVVAGADDFMRGFNDAHNAPTDSIEEHIWIKFLASIFIIVSLIATVYYFVRLLIHIAKSIARKDIFNSGIVKLITRFVIVYSAFIVIVVVFAAIIPESVESTESSVVDIVKLLSSCVFNSVMLLLFAQVIKIGKILKEEVDLTV